MGAIRLVFLFLLFSSLFLSLPFPDGHEIGLTLLLWPSLGWANKGLSGNRLTMDSLQCPLFRGRPIVIGGESRSLDFPSHTVPSPEVSRGSSDSCKGLTAAGFLLWPVFRSSLLAQAHFPSEACQALKLLWVYFLALAALPIASCWSCLPQQCLGKAVPCWSLL
uniref:Uncharacterized protein n=1 Tax=Sphaerodactylus townsendi TaxID=933632 RepID=A0ACB8FF08_9SAUR